MATSPSSWTATFETFVGLGGKPAAPVPETVPTRKPTLDSRYPTESGTRELVNERSQPSSAPTELYAVIQEKQWGIVEVRTRTMSHEASTWIEERNADGTIRWRLLPIHLACESQPPAEVIEALITAYPEGVNLKDSGGDLPIHLACRERASMEAINALLVADPECAKIPDDEGRLALHLACRQGAGLDIVNTLLVAFHKGAQIPDTYGLLPIHWACAQNATIAIIEALLRAYPDATQVKDKWGRTPYSLALASTNAEKDAIMEALNHEPSYWSMSLIQEVHNLRGELDQQFLKEQELEKRAFSMQNKLNEVTAASLTATQTFRDLNAELQNENERLNQRIVDLTEQQKKRDVKIRELNEMNVSLEGRKEALSARLTELSGLLRDMELYRLEILKATGTWEDCLQKAAEVLIGEDDVKYVEQGLSTA